MSFEIALSGINAINTSLDTISNNIANSGTFGFKASRANFSSMYAGTQPIGAQVGSLTQSIDVGGGVLTTGRAMDASIQGRGFFVTKDSAGALLYTRVGIFSTDKNGALVDASGRKVQGYPMVPGTTTLGAFGDITVPTGQVPAQASTQIKYVGNLSSDWTVPAVAPFAPADPLSYNSSMVSVVYDSLGAQHTVTQYFVKSATPGQIDVHYTVDGGAPAALPNLTFGPDGQLTSPASATVPVITLMPAAQDLNITINYAGTTQYAGDTTTTVNSTDGYASGTLTGVELAKDGSVVAQYSNGQKQSVGKIALATFPNESALTAVSDTSWTTSVGSGNALYFTPGTGMTGDLTVGAIEQSNVDMTSELVSLMSSQRNYQANTKVISTENEMMQSLMQAI
ncbi:flagellar hook protein FlgE [Acidovorax soli]|jgi:flagellar hook protein FlgE|uniref:Flagellar hook protein FlgE n=1 Tax=Acidovorax soli TaxID=592050 RepID=A0A7X0PIF4_9BURK|nr:flagellar hook-basal body complex protein [Acidovorax soli]MBB6562533.1 flagellar hook protein FlgE [Acidovorax soli]